MKKCNTCNESNPKLFWKNKTAPDGLSYYCKKCSRERVRKWYEKNRERANKQSQFWRKNNPDKARIIAAKSHKKHREERIERASKYRRANRELIKEQQYRYVMNNKEKVMESKRKWALAHPDKVRAFRLANEQLRRARQKRATIGNVAEIKKFYIYVHTCGIINCTYCGNLVPKGKRHVDHRIPLSRGGEHSLTNLVPSCSSCNLKKFNQTAEEFSLKKHDEWRT